MSFEDMLRADLQDAAETVPVRQIRFGETLARGKRARRQALVLNFAAVAVTVALAVGGAVVLSGGNLGWLPRPPAATPAPDAQKDSRQEAVDEIETALRSWLEAIQSSDEDAAWALMTREAHAEIGRDRFNQMMLSALPEGLGAFADADDFHLVAVTSGGDEARVVGVVSGRISREGSNEFAAAAVPIFVSGGEASIDGGIINPYRDRIAPFASESIGPQSYNEGDELVVEFADPAGIVDAWIALNNNRDPLASRFDSDTGTVRSKLQRDLTAGRHIAVVVVQHKSGRLYAEAIVFRAASS